MATPFVSIIIPIYRSEPYLKKCLDSIISQTITNWEAILIDDGSPDLSGAICDDYANRDNRFKVFHKINGGVSSARNLGLDMASGEFVTFVDSDDYIGPTYLESFARKCDYDLIFTGIHRVGSVDYCMFGENDTNYESANSLVAAFKKCSDEEKKSLGGLSFVACKALRRSILEENHIRFNTNMIYGEDTTLVNCFMLHINNAAQVKGNEYYYDTPASAHVFKLCYADVLSHIESYEKAIIDIETKFHVELSSDKDSYSVSAFIHFFKHYMKMDYAYKKAESEKYKSGKSNIISKVRHEKGAIRTFLCDTLIKHPLLAQILVKIK